MFKNKNIWYVLIILSGLFTYSAFKIFPKAFPILNINLEMTKAIQLENLVGKRAARNLKLCTFIFVAHTLA